MRVCSLKIFTVSTNYNQFTTGLGLGRRESRRKGGLCLLPAVFWMELSKGSTKLWVQTGYYNLFVQTGTKMACFCGIRTRTLASSCDSLYLEVFFIFSLTLCMCCLHLNSSHPDVYSEENCVSSQEHALAYDYPGILQISLILSLPHESWLKIFNSFNFFFFTGVTVLFKAVKTKIDSIKVTW